MIVNSLGRSLPENLFGKKIRPYRGIHESKIRGKRVGPSYQKSIVTRDSKRFFYSIESLLSHLSLVNGTTVSFHHALREGDNVILPIMNAISSFGLKNITLASTALFSVHTPLKEHIESGTISRIEGSINGPLGKLISNGTLNLPVILRSHGGRARAIQEGSLHIDIAFIAASSCDLIGNLNGIDGVNAFGSLGYPLDTDSLYADIVVGVTDSISSEPLEHISIPSSRVDYILEVNSIGNPKKITSGSLDRKVPEERLKIVENVVEVIKLSEYFKNGFNWQAGAGGMSLAASKYLKDLMLDSKVEGGYIFGGIEKNSVEMLQEGFFKRIYDAQSFDVIAIESLQSNKHHVEVSIDHAYNPFNKGCIANHTDFSVLGATEVDLNFNVNANTFSNGRLNSGIGGHQDAARAKISMIVIPIARRVPTIVKKVTTVSTPGDSIDVIITEEGVSINPQSSVRREKLKNELEKAGIKLRKIEDLHAESISSAPICELNQTDQIYGLIEYRDGTHLDVLYQIEE